MKKYLVTNVKRNLRSFKSAYKFNTQYYGYAMFFVIVKLVIIYTHAGFSDIKSKLENMKMSQFKHDIPKANLLISEWTNKIFIDGETSSENLSKQFNLYPTSSWPLFKEHMDTRSSYWDEYKDFTADQVRSMDLEDYNNLLTYGMWSNKDPKDDQILALVIVVQKLVDDSNKSSDNSNTSNRESTKGEQSYITDLPPCMLEYPKGWLVNKTKDGN